ncbi:RNA-guided pseudouridylation complex pseudouridine synthase subunit Cbf5 [Nanoarchaeota archaeon]
MGLLPFEKIKREVLVKKVVDTSDKFGCDPYARPVSEILEYGIINLDKTKGPTSHQMSAYVQKAIGIKKSGHSGTLDPKVTGILPVALGKATRVVQTLLIAGKEYVCLMHLHKEVDEEKIRKVFEEFTGKITQLPPIKSAVKRQYRDRTIYYMDLLDIEGQDVLFTVGCQAGTYIRKLCHDMGQKLGVGAHMHELRRTKAGPFKEDSLVSMHDLVDAYHFWKDEGKEEYIRKVIQPVERAVDHLPKVWVMDTSVNTICNGADLAAPGIAKVESGVEKNKTVAVMTLKDELVALGMTKMSSEEMHEKEKGIAVKTKKVFMKIGTYPKVQK